MNLTPDQQAVADGVLRKLFEGKEQEIIISGPAGTGKSFLIRHILDHVIQKYKATMKLTNSKPKFCYDAPVITATTNKAAAVLSSSLGTQIPIYSASTIESALGLIVKNDYSKGNQKLAPSRGGLNTFTDNIIIIDEASMIDQQLYAYIRSQCIGCFIIFIGDDCQLPAVKAGNIPLIWQLGLPEFKLTSLVRQAENIEIGRLCNQLRDTVMTGNFKPIQLTGSIEQITDPEEQKEILRKIDGYHSKVLTYTNLKSIQYNDWIMEDKHGGFHQPVYASEKYVVNDYFANREVTLRAEDIIEVNYVLYPTTQEYNGVECKFIKIDAITPLSLKRLTIPEDREWYMKWLKYIAKHKDWNNYFGYKNSIVDIRGYYSSTIHKAQGSTYDYVVIDAEDFKSCTNPSIAARLLYVAASRAKHHIYIFGSLPKKYGGLMP